MTGRITRVPGASRPFRHPAGGVGGIGRCRPNDRKDVPVLVHDSEAVGTVGRGESQNVSPERRAERRIVRHAGERYGITRAAESSFVREWQLKDGS